MIREIENIMNTIDSIKITIEKDDLTNTLQIAITLSRDPDRPMTELDAIVRAVILINTPIIEKGRRVMTGTVIAMIEEITETIATMTIGESTETMMIDDTEAMKINMIGIVAIEDNTRKRGTITAKRGRRSIVQPTTEIPTKETTNSIATADKTDIIRRIDIKMMNAAIKMNEIVINEKIDIKKMTGIRKKIVFTKMIDTIKNMRGTKMIVIPIRNATADKDNVILAILMMIIRILNGIIMKRENSPQVVRKDSTQVDKEDNSQVGREVTMSLEIQKTMRTIKNLMLKTITAIKEQPQCPTLNQKEQYDYYAHI